MNLVKATFIISNKIIYSVSNKDCMTMFQELSMGNKDIYK